MAGIVGIGLDADDGHVRFTQGEVFRIYRGSEASHAHMRDTCLRIQEHIRRRGKRLEDLSGDEFVKLVANLDGAC